MIWPETVSAGEASSNLLLCTEPVKDSVGVTAMVALLFRTDAVRRQCCDLAYMRDRWGPDVARRISRRLQQLEAMSTLDDLTFLPFSSHNNGGGRIHVMITPDLALAIEPAPEATEREATMRSVTVTHVLVISKAVRPS
jgi:hypothetical protein